MANKFLCPKCGGDLTYDGNIIFSVKNKYDKVGLLLLSTKLGEYGVKNTPPFRLDMGDKLEFFCPICHSPLECETHENLVGVKMFDNEGHEYEVCFSGVAGEKSTYKIQGKNVTSYGEHSPKYIKSLNLMPEE
ncbi:MAG: hypothetical protein K9I94_13810 [Bacteroidales bacterium]|nr:hypothetical protein [Bacteroidales bacterium]